MEGELLRALSSSLPSPQLCRAERVLVSWAEHATSEELHNDPMIPAIEPYFGQGCYTTDRARKSEPGRPANKALGAAGNAEERFQVRVPAGVRASGHLRQPALLMFKALPPLSTPSL